MNKLYIIIFSIFIIHCSMLFADHRLQWPDTNVSLRELMMLESPLSDAENARTIPVDEDTFSLYDWKNLKYTLSIDSKNNRVFTFRTTFYIDPEYKDEVLTIFVGAIDYPYELYINGEQLGKRGRYKEVYNSAIVESSQHHLIPGLINYGDEPNSFVFQIFPKYEPMPINKLIIGTYEHNTDYLFLKNFIGIRIVQAAVIIALILGLYFMILFFLTGNKNYKNIHFSFLCITFAMAYSNLAISHETRAELLIILIARITLIYSSTFLFFFVNEAALLYRKKKVKRMIIWIFLSLATIVSILIGVNQTKEMIEKTFQLFMNLYILPILLYCLIVLIVVLFRKKWSLIPIFIGFLGLFGSSIHDIMYSNFAIYPFAWLVPHGFLTLVLSIFFYLAFEQATLYKASIEKQLTLDKKNNSLNKMVKEIKGVSFDLIDSTNNINDQVNRSLDVINEYRQSNDKSFSIINSKINEINEMIATVYNTLDLSTQKIKKALLSQEESVNAVNNATETMRDDFKAGVSRINNTRQTTINLSEFAESGKAAILKSKKYMTDILNYSDIINGVLESIKDIAERTHILSINAAIEAARYGGESSGFKVISGEIQKLAMESRKNLDNSFQSINEMHTVIEGSNEITDQVTSHFLNITTEITNTISDINNVIDLFNEQKNKTADIYHTVCKLKNESEIISDISESDAKENEHMKNALSSLQETLVTISDSLQKQTGQSHSLRDYIDKIKESTNKNMDNVELLKRAIQD